MEHETKADKAERIKFETQDDLRTLTRAGDIKSDEGRIKRALLLAKKQLAQIKDA